MLHLELVTDSGEFVRLPFKLYKGNSFWVPQLISEEKKLMNAKLNPFISKNNIIFFIAKRGSEIVGRISLGFSEFFGIEGRAAFFGHFEVIEDYEVCKYIFHRITDFVKEQGIKTIIGPIDFSTNFACGLLIDGFEKQPAILMPYNHKYYQDFLEKSGFKKLVDLYSFEITDSLKIPEKMEEFEKRVLEKFIIKNITYKYLKQNTDMIAEFFNQTWSANLLFQKLHNDQTLFLVENFKDILNPAISFAVYDKVRGQNKLAAFSISLPDYSPVLKYLNGRFNIFKLPRVLSMSRKISTLRTAILGVSPQFRRQGVDILMIMKTIRNGMKCGFKKAEISWILETNKLLLNTIQKFTSEIKNIYRIYKLSL